MLAQRVHHGRAHAVQTAGDLVAAAAKLAARVQYCQTDLHCGTAHLGMDAHGEAASVVLDRYAAVLVQGDVDLLAVARQRLVNRVVHNFIHKMMKAPGVGGADIHTRALADGL